MGILTNKRALIVGVLNERSIAYGIAQCLHREGAQLAFTYQGEKLKERVTNVAKKFGSDLIMPCDLAKDEDIGNVIKTLSQKWDGLEIIIHSAAFAPSDQLAGDYLDCVNREGFRIAHDISSYSFAALAKAARPMMQQAKNGALLTISYIGAQRVVPNYNVMGIAKASLEANVRYLASSLGKDGIRVNAISAGPIRTIAASGVKNLHAMLAQHETIVPLRRNITLEDVGNAAAFLCSDLAAGVTGDILYVDSGFHIVGLPMQTE